MGRPGTRPFRAIPGSFRSWARYGVVVVLVVGLVLSVGSAVYIGHVRDQHRDEAAAERVGVVQARLEQRLEQAVNTLESLRPLWVLKREPTRDDFHRMVETGVADPGSDPATYGGLDTIAFVRSLEPGDATPFLDERRAELPEAYTADLGDGTPHYVVDFYAPDGSTIVGTDLYPLPNRREPLERARDEGRAIATDWFHHVSDLDRAVADRRYVSVIAVPVYAGTRRVPPTLIARRGLHVGWLVTPLSAGPLLEELGAGLSVGLRLHAPDQQVAAVTSGIDGDGLVQATRTERLGRAWPLDVVVPTASLADPAATLVNPLAVLVVGLLLTTLLAALLRSQYAANDRAEQRAAEATRELRARKQSLRVLAERVPAAILDLDARARVTWVNTRMLELFGLPPATSAEEVSRLIREGIHEDDRDAYREAWRGALREGRPLQFRHRYRIADGRVGWSEVAATPILDEQGRATRWLASISDVSTTVRARQQIEAARDAAIENAQTKSAFLANMSHEIRTPLNGVIGMAGLLLDSSLDETQREHVVTLRRSADELLVLLNDILDLSRIESGRLQVEAVPFAPVRLLEGVVRQHGSEAFGKGLELRLEVDDDVPPALLGDPVRVRQVLHNLVGNAVKFTRSGRVVVSIAAEVSDTDARVTFAVADTGPGIPAEVRGQIFEAFTQADATTTRRFGGTGLGLSISRQLADLMHGDILVDSVVGVGSRFTFTVTLPVTERAPAGDELEPAEPRDATQATERLPEALHVLLVEDNVVNQHVALGLLERLGVTADLAGDGQAALDAAATGTYDVILMDCQMPRMDGYVATRQLRGMEGDIAHTPVIAMTAAAMSGDRERCLEAGMDDYVAKPVRVEHLRAALERCAGGRRPAAVATPATCPPDVLPVLDDTLVGQLQAIPGLLTDVRDRYRESSAVTLAQLREDVAAADWGAAARTAHKLKGSSASMGATRLADLLARVEDDCTNGTAPASDRLVAVTDLLAQTVQALQEVEPVG